MNERPKHFAVTASQLDRFIKCPASIYKPEGSGEKRPGSPADTGSKLHECIRAYIRSGYNIEVGLELAAELEVLEEWLLMDVEIFRKLKMPEDVMLERTLGLKRDYFWGYLKKDYGEAPYSYAMVDEDQPLFYGTADAIWKSDAGTELHIADWKTGLGLQERVTHNHQLKSLLACYNRASPAEPPTRFFGHMVYPMLGLVETIEYSPKQIEIECHIAGAMTRLNVSFHAAPKIPGSHCTYCDNKSRCINVDPKDNPDEDR